MASKTSELETDNAAVHEALLQLQGALQRCAEAGLNVWCDQLLVTTAELCDCDSLIELA